MGILHFYIRITQLKLEPGLFLISNQNLKNLKLTLPQIMCLKCFSLNTESFTVENIVWKPSSIFSKNLPNKAVDSYKNDISPM